MLQKGQSIYYPGDEAGCFTQANENVFMTQFRFGIGHSFVTSCVLEEEMSTGRKDCIMCPHENLIMEVLLTGWPSTQHS